MLSPFMTVVVLVVLWLIVVVPMVLRRNDERRRERSVAEWGRGMRALGPPHRRAASRTDAGPQPSEVFVPRRTEPRSPPRPAGPCPPPRRR